MKRVLPCLLALALTAALLLFRPGPGADPLPGVPDGARDLVRIWCVSSIGGGQAWLKAALRRYEQANPGVMTYTRTVDAGELTAPDAVLPDLVLYMPGDLTDPSLFAPLSGVLMADEPLLRCGRWQGRQLGLPLCWSGYVLVLDGSLDPAAAATPAPTTLLGRPAATDAPDATPTPGFPLEAAMRAAEPVQAPSGAALFSLGLTLGDRRPPLPEQIGTLTSSEVYQRYLSRGCASAMLTGGQLTALQGLAAAGKAAAYRVMVPDTVVTDQVWLGSVVRDASPRAAEVLAWLTDAPAQRLLADQELHPVQAALRLYAAGTPLLLDRAAARSLTCINAFIPRADAAQAARLYLQNAYSLVEALLPLI